MKPWKLMRSPSRDQAPTLDKYGYPPDKQPTAIDTILKQAEEMANFFY
ncbi:MAG TPA: type I restriction enzyme endonuclease domain-containing protein [Puia sp.]|nr:type I restriction enzyme endonuclease domain-containing protein [Puia sp.]